jgi:hypothetical protein
LHSKLIKVQRLERSGSAALQLIEKKGKVMKNKITRTMLTAIIALPMMSTFGYSQYNFYTPENMGLILNSTFSDVAPLISPNGLSFYFASSRAGGLGGNDIWVSQRASLQAAWGPAQNLGATVNTSSLENPSAFSLDGLTMFLFSNRPGLGGRDLYISTRSNPNDDFGWTTPINLGAPVNGELDELGATFFEDPTTGTASLIFSSNRVGNPATDYHLFVSTRNANGTFNTPVFMKDLSTPGKSTDVRAAIRRDGLEIYFASIRPGGVAPPFFDIWVSNRASTVAAWSTPVLVAGANTVDDDTSPSLSPDGAILYFQSTRPGGVGSIDLFASIRCSLFLAPVIQRESYCSGAR